MSKTVVGLYRDFDSAQRTVSDLVDAGIPQDRISLLRKDPSEMSGSSSGGGSSSGSEGKVDAGSGAVIGAGTGAVLGGAAGALLAGVGNIFIPGLGGLLGVGPVAATIIGGAGIGAVSGGIAGALTNAGVPEEHAQYYSRGVESGGTLVTVHADDQDQAERAADIMGRYGPLDVDSNEDYAGTSTTTAAPAMGLTDTTETTTTTSTVRPMAADMTTPDVSTTRPAAFAGSTERLEGDRAIPIVQEDINIGKRQVEAGTARVRTRVYERPVEETVTLRDEKLNVERRATDRPLRPGEDAFREETIEVRETREEPVVSKTARVVEEVVIDKQAVEHTETVRDTVRKTDVEVDRDVTTTRERSKLNDNM